MKRVNTKGLQQANKCLTLSAVAYNIKKLLKHKSLLVQTMVQEMTQSLKNGMYHGFLSHFKRHPVIFRIY
jgi:hypothetical protein